MMETTIAAIATPTGRGGIGIIRMSGPKAREIALLIFKRRKITETSNLETHRMYYGHIYDNHKKTIDEVMMVFMKGPKSYTAEDVIEIQSHSSPIVLRKILDVMLNHGAVMAEPGEFTKRAFLNGRIDLTQAEAVIDIINARTSTSLDMAVSQIQGHLKKQIKTMLDKLYDQRAMVEASIDFPDDVGDGIDEQIFKTSIEKDVYPILSILKKNFNDTNIFRDGIKVAIAGPPNAGKSSLLNALVNKDKSIVTPIPGTTRDLIDDLINIEGIPFELTDTAGLQETEDQIEKIGIERTLDRIKHSDLILLMYDGSQTLTGSDEKTMINLYQKYKKSKKIMVVENKIDLYSNTKPLCLGIKTDIRISVKNREGLHELKKKIADVVMEDLPEDRSSVVPNIRHIRLIDHAMTACETMIEGVREHRGWELIAVDLEICIESLEDILGNSVREDVLDRIFETFCIGK